MFAVYRANKSTERSTIRLWFKQIGRLNGVFDNDILFELYVVAIL